MNKTILIDAAQAGEVRVAVVKNGQIDDFDIEAENHKQLRGNTYLGKVTRVEPSLQAAFVEYGGNRQGFLAFDEIHPDYYQIPQEDREALQAEVEAAMAAREDTDGHLEKDEDQDADSIDPDDAEDIDNSGDHDAEDDSEYSDSDLESAAENGVDVEDETRTDSSENTEDSDHGNETDETLEMGRRLQLKLSRRYKIQEVIKTRQVLLVQVVKEERGTKGAALTTYLSLAGRYCVLMPSSMRGGGVSRKITSLPDRKRLKKIVSGFDIPPGMGLIVRTAGAKQSADEIRGDYEYLLRLWSDIRERTLESVAPCLVHEESRLILRAVRDLYNSEVSGVYVSGEETYAEIDAFFDKMMPDQKDRIHFHDDTEGPLFANHGVESQLDELFSPVVPLPSGGYLVIHQTEALVAIDVNSGKATRERNIESTAVRTNEEAALETSRQIRLRDLAGLIVIDFIDMEETRNIRNIERRMKEALSVDRARVQMGRISRFGLMEISRQRRRIGVMEVSSEPCRVCAGTGRVRSASSIALKILRVLRELLYGVTANQIEIEARHETIMYLLNDKRAELAALEAEYGLPLITAINDTLSADEFVLHKIVKERKSELTEPRRSARRVSRTASAAKANGSASTEKKQHSRRSNKARDPQTAEDSTDTATRENGTRPRNTRRRGGRRRVPDMAIDGGEKLEAIASAPFLEPKPTPTPNGSIPSAGSKPKPSKAKGSDEPAADTPEQAPKSESLPPPPQEAVSDTMKEPIPTSLHSVHAPIKEDTSKPSAPRRRGWWSRSLSE